MKLDEVTDPIKQVDARAGVYPVYTDEEGQTFVHMMIPSDPKFGGLLPQMGKGGIDEGESAAEAAMREGYEELGLLANNVARMTLLTTSIRTGKKEKYNLTVFVAEVKDPDNFDPAGWESKWAGWVELEEAIKTSRKNQLQFLRLLQSKYAGKPLEEADDQEQIAYKVMSYNPSTMNLVSTADQNLVFSAGPGDTLRMGGQGIYMSTNKNFVMTYYSELAEYEALVTFKFNPADITSGNITDRESEFTVPYAKIVDIKYLENTLNEAFDINDIYNELQKWEKEFTMATPQTGNWHTIKAKLSFLRSQIELSKDHGVEPVSGPSRTADLSQGEFKKSLEPVIKAIKQHCQPYLKSIDNDIEQYRMFRGMRGTDAVVMTGRVRLDKRSPKNTGDETHKYINRYFQVRYGERFRDAMFVSGSADFAKDYGNLFLVFPRGEFTFIWSPNVIDIFDIDGDIDEAMYPFDGPGLDSVDVKSLFKYMDTLKYQTDDMKEALFSQKEVMVRTQAYYGINLTEFFQRDDYDDDSKGDQDKINTAINLIQELLNAN